MAAEDTVERTTLQIAEQAPFLKSILESSTEYSIIAKDLKGTILAWNEGARRIYGYEASDVTTMFAQGRGSRCLTNQS